MPEKIIIDKETLESYKPSIVPNGAVLAVLDKVEDTNDIITDILGYSTAFANTSINNNACITGVIVAIAENFKSDEVPVKLGDRILCVTNKVSLFQDNKVKVFLATEPQILAIVDQDIKLDITKAKTRNLGNKDDFIGF